MFRTSLPEQGTMFLFVSIIENNYSPEDTFQSTTAYIRTTYTKFSILPKLALYVIGYLSPIFNYFFVNGSAYRLGYMYILKNVLLTNKTSL